MLTVDSNFSQHAALTAAPTQTTHEETLGGPVDALLYIQGFLFVAYVKGTVPNVDGIINFYNTAAGKTQMIPGHRVRSIRDRGS